MEAIVIRAVYPSLRFFAQAEKPTPLNRKLRPTLYAATALLLIAQVVGAGLILNEAVRVGNGEARAINRKKRFDEVQVERDLVGRRTEAWQQEGSLFRLRVAEMDARDRPFSLVERFRWKHYIRELEIASRTIEHEQKEENRPALSRTIWCGPAIE